MMRIMTTVVVVLLLTSLAHGDATTPPVEAPEEKLGYAIGYRVGSDFRRDGTKLDADAVVAGVRDALEGTTPRWSVRDMRDALRRLEQDRRSSPIAAP